MKEKVRCYKCGKEFESAEGMRSDICPGCMSFIDLPLARKAYLERQDGQEEDVFPSRESPSEAEEKQPFSPLRESKPPAAGALADAEKLLEAGVWSAALEEFYKALQEKDCWQAHWGVVRAATRELSDFSAFPSVRENAEAALDTMPAQERRQAGARYVPQLSVMRRRTADALKAAQHVEPPPAEAKMSQKFSVWFILAGVAFMLCFFLGIALLGNTGAAMGFSVAGGILLSLSVALLFFLILAGIVRARKAERVRKVAQTVAESLAAQQKAETEKLRRKLDDIDFLCGFLKY